MLRLYAARYYACRYVGVEMPIGCHASHGCFFILIFETTMLHIIHKYAFIYCNENPV